MRLNIAQATMLLLQCSGDEIWSETICREKGIPELWINELVDNFESGFDSDRNTIYLDQGVVNQYRGVLDLHLAYKLSEFLGIDWQKATAGALSRRAEVAAMQAEIDEL